MEPITGNRKRLSRLVFAGLGSYPCRACSCGAANPRRTARPVWSCSCPVLARVCSGVSGAEVGCLPGSIRRGLQESPHTSGVKHEFLRSKNVIILIPSLCTRPYGSFFSSWHIVFNSLEASTDAGVPKKQISPRVLKWPRLAAAPAANHGRRRESCRRGCGHAR